MHLIIAEWLCRFFIGLGVLFLVLLVFGGISACILSSRISQEERERGDPDDEDPSAWANKRDATPPR
jgi:hypothetical protein